MHRAARTPAWGLIGLVGLCLYPWTTSAADGGIQFHGAAGTAVLSTATSVTVSRPAGFQPGDLLIAALSVDSNTSQVDAGMWTLLDQIIDSVNGHNGFWFYRVTGASEPASYTFGISQLGPFGAYAAVVAYGDVDPTNPVRSHVGGDTTGSPWVSPQQAFLQPGDWVSFGFAVNTTAGADSWTPPAGVSLRLGQAQLALFDNGPADAGTVGPFSVSSTATSGGGTAGHVETLVLVPTSPAPTDGGMESDGGSGADGGNPDAGLKVGCGCAHGTSGAVWLGVLLLVACLPLKRLQR